MKVFIVYCHPSDDSFTRKVFDSFICGLDDAGTAYCTSDLYKMNFLSDITEKEYLRDSNYLNSSDIAPDVLEEQRKINSCDAIVFIYPIFWTEAPAKLVGWFDRVWSYGFAYGNKTMKVLEKSLFLCTAGHYVEDLEKYGLLQSMKKIMLGDRMFKRSKRNEFIVFGGMTKDNISYKEKMEVEYLNTSYEKAKNLFNDEQVFSLDGKYFTAVENTSSGEVSDATIFSYHQKDSAVWAEYSGGKIIKGFLIGTINTDKSLHFMYQHLNNDGCVRSGKCKSIPRFKDDGTLQFIESWQWDTGDSGSSVIEEI